MKTAITKQSENGYAWRVATWLNHNTDPEARKRILLLIKALCLHGKYQDAAPPEPIVFEDYNKPSVAGLRTINGIVQSVLNLYDIRLIASSVQGKWEVFWEATPGSEQAIREQKHRDAHPPTIMEEAVGPETHGLRYVWEASRDGTLQNVVQCSNDCGRWTIRRSSKENQFCGSTCYRAWYGSRAAIKAKRAATARKNYKAARTLEQGKSFRLRAYKKKPSATAKTR